jgi:hypothetical protein
MKPFVDFIPDWIDDVDLEAKENYRYKYAVENFHRLQEARKMFPDAVAWGVWIFKDRTNQEPLKRFPCCRYANGGGWTPKADDAFPRLRERQEATFEHNGNQIALFRWETGISVLEEYSPQSPEWIEKQADKRLQKKHARERASMPLFADQIAEEQGRRRF